MIAVVCKSCGSTNLSKNGYTKLNQQKYHCNNCNYYGTITNRADMIERERQLVQNMYLEGLSQRAIARVTGLSRNTVSRIIKTQ